MREGRESFGIWEATTDLPPPPPAWVATPTTPEPARLSYSCGCGRVKIEVLTVKDTVADVDVSAICRTCGSGFGHLVERLASA